MKRGSGGEGYVRGAAVSVRVAFYFERPKSVKKSGALEDYRA